MLCAYIFGIHVPAEEPYTTSTRDFCKGAGSGRQEDNRPPGNEVQAASFSTAGKSTGIFVVPCR
jgi:hypothetical protein